MSCAFLFLLCVCSSLSFSHSFFFCLASHMNVWCSSHRSCTHIIYTWLRFSFIAVCVYFRVFAYIIHAHTRIDEAQWSLVQVCVCAYMQYICGMRIWSFVPHLLCRSPHSQCAFLVLLRCVFMWGLCAFLFNDDYSLVILAMCV